MKGITRHFNPLAAGLPGVVLPSLRRGAVGLCVQEEAGGGSPTRCVPSQSTQSWCLSSLSPASWGCGGDVEGTRSWPAVPQQVGCAERAAFAQSWSPALVSTVHSAWQRSGAGCALLHSCTVARK